MPALDERAWAGTAKSGDTQLMSAPRQLAGDSAGWMWMIRNRFVPIIAKPGYAVDGGCRWER